MSLDARLAVTGAVLLLVGSGLFLRTGVDETVPVALAGIACAGLAVALVRTAFPPRRTVRP